MESASAEQIKRFAAQASKGGSAAFESRETADPAMIMHMLGSLLEALGSKSDKTPCLRKRVKDEVQWANSLNPWRRSPFWLILRVGLSTFLAQKHGGEKGRAYYKTLLAAALATFLRIFGPDLDPETAAFVNAKLARRVAKLENERTNADGEVSAVLGVLFGKLGPFFLQTLETRRKSIEENWRAFKNSSQVKRPIGFLPKYARDYETKPALTSSHPYLQAVMLWRPLRAPNPEVVQSVASAMATSARFHVFASGYFDLARTEQHYEARRRDQSDVQLVGSQKKNCIRLAGEIETYLDQVRGLYNENHEQYSICVLTVMELWVEMDRSATAEYSPLLKFNTVFRPESLDVLTLPRLVDMQRLQTIQAYIQQRDRKCNSSAQTIFDDPSPGCFAEVYFDDSKHSQKLESLMKEIEDFAQKTRLEKESELKTLSAEYEKLQTQIAQSACTYSNSDGYVGAVHDRKRCHKCYLGRKAHRLKIDLFEYPTPADSSEAKAVIFELQCPEAYAKYRNATFKIASRFASAHNTQAAPKVLLKDLFDLQRFKRASMEGVSLASHSKSFIATHYESVRLPTTLSKVCVRNGLKLGYYEQGSGIWTKDARLLVRFHEFCFLRIPQESPFRGLQNMARS